MKKIVTSLFLAVLVFASANAQVRSVTGTVKDDKGVAVGGSPSVIGLSLNIFLNNGVGIRHECNNKTGVDAEIISRYAIFNHTTGCEVYVTRFEAACIRRLDILSASQLNKFRIACGNRSKMQSIETEVKLLNDRSAYCEKVIRSPGPGESGVDGSCLFECPACMHISSISGNKPCTFCSSRQERRMVILKIPSMQSLVKNLEILSENLKKDTIETGFREWPSWRLCPTCKGSGLLYAGMVCTDCMGAGGFSEKGEEI